MAVPNSVERRENTKRIHVIIRYLKLAVHTGPWVHTSHNRKLPSAESHWERLGRGQGLGAVGGCTLLSPVPFGIPSMRGQGAVCDSPYAHWPRAMAAAC